MTSIFTKVKPGDLITSDLFNQITDKIEEMHEITAVMEVKKNSEADASELGNLSVKGNVGIGTKDSPSEKLEVNGTVKTGNDGQLLLLKGIKSSKKGEESSMNLDFMTSSQDRTSPSIPTASVRAIDDDKSAHLGFFTNEVSEDQYKLTERLRITSNGKVGIGTTDPSEKLEVSGIVKADKFKGDGSGLTGIKTGQWTDVAGGISYNSGNIGIGSDSPENADGWSRVLDILGSNTTKLSIRTQNIDARVLSHENGFWGAPVGMIVGTKSAHSLSFGTGATSRMTINKDGNIGIGTSTPSAKLEVNGDIKARAIEAKPALHDFKVEGDLDKFYPVLFRDDNWAEGPLILEINRPDVNTDSEDRGSLISKFTVHSPKLGNSADMCRAEIYDSGTQFIAGYQNDNFSDRFVVWLRGGGTTYYFRSNHFATLEDFSATEKKYKVNEKEITFIIKTSVDSNVLSSTIHFDKSLIIDGKVGIGTTPQKEKLEVSGTVKADKFLGDGSGLTGIKTGQWTDVTGGVSYNSGNVGIGTTDIKCKLHVEGNNSVIHSGGPGAGFSFANRDTKTFVDTPSKGERWIWYSSGDPGVAYLWSGKNLLFIDKDGKVGIGTTPQKEKLEVSGTVKADKFLGDGSGLTGIKTGQWTDVAGGVSYTGNVGIGTDKPQRSLHVLNNDGQCLVLQSNKGGAGSTVSLDFQTYPNNQLSPTASLRTIDDGKFSSHLTFSTKEPGTDQNGLKERLRITADGNVGIGTTAPSEKLEVSGTVKAAKFVGDGSGLTGIASTNKTQWTDVTGGISYNSGNVGIGTDKPENADGWTKVLDILGSGTTKLSVRTQNIDARVLSHENGWWGAPAGMIVGTKSAHSLSFGTNATSRMTINKDGNVGIGTTDPQAKLTVSGVPSTVKIETAEIMRLWRIGVPGVKNTNSASLLLGSFEEGSGGRTRLDFNLSGAPGDGNTWGFIPDVNVMSLLANGNVGIGTTKPDSKLEVWGGDIHIEGGRTFYSHGRMHINGEETLFLLNKNGVVIGKEWGGNGNLSVEGAKNFSIDHPLHPDTHKLVHSTLEGPEIAVFYRGEAQLSNGEMTILLPDYFETLTRKENRTVLLTPKFEGELGISVLAASEVKDGKFTVKMIDNKNPSQKFYWEVKAVRADIEILEVEQVKTSINSSV